MDLLVIPFLIICFWGCRVRFRDYFENCLCIEHTVAVRGILAVTVVLHHLYMEADSGVLHLLISNAGTLCVMLFLFLSGYGLQKSFLKKQGYGKTVLLRRIPAIAKPFVLLIPVYWGLYALMGKSYSLTEVLATLVSGSPIVRYGWYTLCLMLLYLLFCLGTLLFEKRRNWTVPGMFGLTLVLILVLMQTMPPFWYYSLWAFPLGILWADREELLTRFFRRYYWLWLSVSGAVFAAGFCGALTTYYTVFFWLTSWGFLLFTVLLLQKCRFGNPALDFLGKLSFEIYSVHGFFMLLYRSELIYIGSDVLWGAAVIASAIPAAWLLKQLCRGKTGR